MHIGRRLMGVTHHRIRRLACGALMGLVVACGPAGGAGDSDETASLVGSVVAGPGCPVEQVGSPCPPIPVPSAVVQLLDGSEVVAETRTGNDGRFHLSALAGRFVVRVESSNGLPSEATRPVRLTSGGTTAVRMMLDSGIR